MYINTCKHVYIKKLKTKFSLLRNSFHTVKFLVKSENFFLF